MLRNTPKAVEGQGLARLDTGRTIGPFDAATYNLVVVPGELAATLAPVPGLFAREKEDDLGDLPLLVPEEGGLYIPAGNPDERFERAEHHQSHRATGRCDRSLGIPTHRHVEPKLRDGSGEAGRVCSQRHHRIGGQSSGTSPTCDRTRRLHDRMPYGCRLRCLSVASTPKLEEDVPACRQGYPLMTQRSPVDLGT